MMLRRILSWILGTLFVFIVIPFIFVHTAWNTLSSPSQSSQVLKKGKLYEWAMAEIHAHLMMAGHLKPNKNPSHRALLKAFDAQITQALSADDFYQMLKSLHIQALLKKTSKDPHVALDLHDLKSRWALSMEEALDRIPTCSPELSSKTLCLKAEQKVDLARTWHQRLKRMPDHLFIHAFLPQWKGKPIPETFLADQLEKLRYVQTLGLILLTLWLLFFGLLRASPPGKMWSRMGWLLAGSGAFYLGLSYGLPHLSLNWKPTLLKSLAIERFFLMTEDHYSAFIQSVLNQILISGRQDAWLLIAVGFFSWVLGFALKRRIVYLPESKKT